MAAETEMFWSGFWLGALVTVLCSIGAMICLTLAVKWPPRYLDEYDETITEHKALRGE